MSSAKRLFSGENIGCARGGAVLFQNLSFALDGGDVLRLAGPNGSGKTSFLRILCGILPSEGHIHWQGVYFLENGFGEHARRFAFLPAHDRALKPAETVFETLQFWGGDTAGALRRMNLGKLKETPVRRLSAGQKRRLSLARVFLKPAPLWLLDEPLNGLDAESRALFDEALEAHGKAGGIAVIASHQEIGTGKTLEIGA